MAAAGIAAAPVHALMHSPRSSDLRNRIDNRASPLPSRSAVARVRGTSFVSEVSAGSVRDPPSQAHHLVRSSSVITSAPRDSGNAIQPKGQQPIEQASVQKPDERMQAPGARLTVTEAELQRLREADGRREALEKERETWLAERQGWTTERQLLVEAALLMRDACDAAASETEDALSRLLAVIDSDEISGEESCDAATPEPDRGCASVEDPADDREDTRRSPGAVLNGTDLSPDDGMSLAYDVKRYNSDAEKPGSGSAQNRNLRRLLRKEIVAALAGRRRRAARLAVIQAKVPPGSSHLFEAVLKSNEEDVPANGDVPWTESGNDDDDGDDDKRVTGDMQVHPGYTQPRLHDRPLKRASAHEAARLKEDDSSSTKGSERHQLDVSLLLDEYRKVHSLVCGFKGVMTRITKGTDSTSILDNQETIVSDKAVPTIEAIQTMTADIAKVLTNACTAMNAALSMDSAASPSLVSKIPGAGMTPPPTQDQEKRTVNSDTIVSKDIESKTSHEAQIRHLQRQIINMHAEQRIIREVQKDDTRSNAKLISAMQGHVRDLHEQVTSVEQAGSLAVSSAKDPARSHEDVRVVFTRLDAERNTKALKRALQQNKLSSQQAAEAIGRMEAYLEVPQRRLVELTKKYIHHDSLRQADANRTGAKQAGRRLDQQDKDLLNKMESLQTLRHKQWRQKMEALGFQRTQLAAGLMEALEGIEQQSGIFLIKPTLSNQHRHTLEQRYKSATVVGNSADRGTLDASANKQVSRQPSVSDRRRAYSSMDISELPARVTNQRSGLPRRTSSGGTASGLFPARSATALHRPKAFTRSSAATWTYLPPTALEDAGQEANGASWLSAPRILALDINRFTFGHERAAVQAAPASRGQRNASSATTRSYMTIARTPSRRAPAASSSFSSDSRGGAGQTPAGAPISPAAADAIDMPAHDNKKVVEPVNVLGSTTPNDAEQTEEEVDEDRGGGGAVSKETTSEGRPTARPSS